MPSSEVRTNVVMISWNALEFTELAIGRLFDTVNHPYSLTVVDNGSTDGTIEYLDTLKPTASCIAIRSIMNYRNLGPGAAYSQGYEISRELGTDYTVLSNNDVYFQYNWLETLESTMDADSRLGILGTLQPTSGTAHPYNNELDAKRMMGHAPDALSPKQELDYFFRGHDFDQGAHDIIQANGGGLRYFDMPPDAVPTSCAIVRNSAVADVGFIADPRYETYGSEDIDFSWELGRLGYRGAMQYNVYTHHFRHRSAKAGGLDLKQCLAENNLKFVKKWYDTIALLLDSCMEIGQNPSDIMCNENDKSFLKLRRINDNVGFWRDGRLVSIEEVGR